MRMRIALACHIVEKETDSFNMDKEPEFAAEPEDKHSFSWRMIILWLFVILLLYVLSIGPVLRMVTKSKISYPSKFLIAFYMPLNWAYETKTFHKPLGTYLHLWVPERLDKNGNEL